MSKMSSLLGVNKKLKLLLNLIVLLMKLFQLKFLDVKDKLLYSAKMNSLKFWNNG